MKKAVIVSAVRTAVGKAKKGTLANYRPEDMGAATVAEAVKRAQGLDARDIDDVIIGCAFPEGQQGMNMARLIALRAGLRRIRENSFGPGMGYSAAFYSNSLAERFHHAKPDRNDFIYLSLWNRIQSPFQYPVS